MPTTLRAAEIDAADPWDLHDDACSVRFFEAEHAPDFRWPYPLPSALVVNAKVYRTRRGAEQAVALWMNGRTKSPR